MTELQPTQFVHSMANGQMHFPGIVPPPEPQPVHYDQERSQLSFRETRRKTNAIHRGRAGLIRQYSPERERPSVFPVVGIQERALHTPWEHAVFRSVGKVEHVPYNQIRTYQDRVQPARVRELIQHPERGSSVRFPPGDELPYAERREGDTNVKLLNGNHRVHADLAKGRLLHPIRVIDYNEPDTAERVEAKRSQLADAHAAAFQKTDEARQRRQQQMKTASKMAQLAKRQLDAADRGQ